MGKNNHIVLETSKYRIVERGEGVYRLQYRKRLSFHDFVFRKNPWKTISIDFYDLARLKVKLYVHQHLNKW